MVSTSLAALEVEQGKVKAEGAQKSLAQAAARTSQHVF
jgi:hypothetical protein